MENKFIFSLILILLSITNTLSSEYFVQIKGKRFGELGYHIKRGQKNTINNKRIGSKIANSIANDSESLVRKKSSGLACRQGEFNVYKVTPGKKHRTYKGCQEGTLENALRRKIKFALKLSI